MSEVTQYEGILTYVDAAGNETEMYPEVKTDESLTVSGKAADAKAVGDKITEAMKNAGGKAINLTQEEYDALPEEKKKNGIYVTPGGDDLTAKNMFYDGSVTGLGNNVQDAIDEQSKNLVKYNPETDKLDVYENGVLIGSIPTYFRSGIALVPTLTSNDGNVLGSAGYSGLDPWKAFNGTNVDTNDSWVTQGNGTNVAYLGYNFRKQTTVKKVYICNRNEATPRAIKSFKLQGSNDLVNWYNIQEFHVSSALPIVEESFNVESTQSYVAFRIFVTGVTDTAYCGLGKLQFYGGFN